MVSDIVQNREGLMKKERFVVKDHNDVYSCLVAAGKIRLLRGNHDKKTKCRSRRVEHRRGNPWRRQLHEVEKV